MESIVICSSHDGASYCEQIEIELEYRAPGDHEQIREVISAWPSCLSAHSLNPTLLLISCIVCESNATAGF
jgi:hypothetical protein